MQTFREVLQRKDEREHLKQMGLCVVVVLVLVAVAFGFVHMKFLLRAQPAGGFQDPVASEARVNRFP